MPELKPCPFCGGNAAYYTGTTHYLPSHPCVLIHCTNCGVSSKEFVDNNRDGSFMTYAAEAWNNRYKQEEPTDLPTQDEED